MEFKDYCTLSPDNIGGTYIGDACGHHDTAYAKGGTEEDRINADKALKAIITERVNRTWGWIYYIGVRLFGESHFNYKIKRRKKMTALKSRTVWGFGGALVVAGVQAIGLIDVSVVSELVKYAAGVVGVVGLRGALE